MTEEAEYLWVQKCFKRIWKRFRHCNILWYFILVFITSILIYCPFFIATMMVLHRTAQKVSERISQGQQ